MDSRSSVTRRLGSRMQQWRALAGTVGPLGACKYAALRGIVPEVRVRPRSVRYPVRIRGHSSDYEVVRQIFIEREYAPLDDLRDVDLVVDCGANVGYSSAYFLSRFPDAMVLAVEPDAENFAQLERNLAPYGPRAQLLRGGVWPATCGLRMSRTPYRDGRAWARQVEPCPPGEEEEFSGYDIPALLARAGRTRISLLKIDIEGAEVPLFSQGPTDWLDRVDTIAIELHDDSAFGSGTAAFHAAIAGRGFSLARRGELTLARRA